MVLLADSTSVWLVLMVLFLVSELSVSTSYSRKLILKSYITKFSESIDDILLVAFSLKGQTSPKRLISSSWLTCIEPLFWSCRHFAYVGVRSVSELFSLATRDHVTLQFSIYCEYVGACMI